MTRHKNTFAVWQPIANIHTCWQSVVVTDTIDVMHIVWHHLYWKLERQSLDSMIGERQLYMVMWLLLLMMVRIAFDCMLSMMMHNYSITVESMSTEKKLIEFYSYGINPGSKHTTLYLNWRWSSGLNISIWRCCRYCWCYSWTKSLCIWWNGEIFSRGIV